MKSSSRTDKRNAKWAPLTAMLRKKSDDSFNEMLRTRKIVGKWTAEKIKPFSKKTQKDMGAALQKAAAKAAKDFVTEKVTARAKARKGLWTRAIKRIPKTPRLLNAETTLVVHNGKAIGLLQSLVAGNCRVSMSRCMYAGVKTLEQQFQNGMRHKVEIIFRDGENRDVYKITYKEARLQTRQIVIEAGTSLVKEYIALHSNDRTEVDYKVKP